MAPLFHDTYSLADMQGNLAVCDGVRHILCTYARMHQTYVQDTLLLVTHVSHHRDACPT